MLLHEILTLDFVFTGIIDFVFMINIYFFIQEDEKSKKKKKKKKEKKENPVVEELLKDVS